MGGTQPAWSSSNISVATSRTGSATTARAGETTGSMTANAAGCTTEADEGEVATETTPSGLPRRVKAAVTWARGVRNRIQEYVKLSVFLAFPQDSLFADPAVEEL